jgi:hypothetical protein
MPVEKSKVGKYFIVIGLILMVIFFISSQARHPAFGYLLGGLGLLLLGGTLYFRDRKPADSNTARFRSVRKVQQRRDKRKEEREKRRDQKIEEREHRRTKQSKETRTKETG